MQAQNSTSPKKPSPLSFGSPRTSPFKRPEAPLIRSPSTLRPADSSQSLAKSQTLYPASLQPCAATTLTAVPAVQQTVTTQTTVRESATVIVAPAAITQTITQTTSHSSSINNDAVSRLHPAQVRDLRESFQILDRDNDGRVTREDVAEVLTQLGLDTSPAMLHPYFPANSAAPLTLPNYLSSLSTLLAAFSPEPELLAAFAAFDIDDSGQIDVDDLRDALLHTYPETGTSTRAMTGPEVDSVMEAFRGRRALAKDMFGGKEAGRRGEVFRYKDFMNTISPAQRDGQGNKAPAAAPAIVKA